MNKNNAMNLAEILITLGIIGVIAAILIPPMVNRTKKAELQSQFKKSYSTLMSATNQLKYDNGFNSFLDEYPMGIASRQKFMTDLKPYLNAKFCETNAECGEPSTSSGYLTPNKNPYYLFGDTAYSLLLQDGSIIRVSAISTNGIYIDTNGYKKKPNRAGYDLFEFTMTSDGKIVPSSKTNYCSLTSTSIYNGNGCTAYAITNKNPDDNSKDYWNDFLSD